MGITPGQPLEGLVDRHRPAVEPPLPEIAACPSQLGLFLHLLEQGGADPFQFGLRHRRPLGPHSGKGARLEVEGAPPRPGRGGAEPIADLAQQGVDRRGAKHVVHRGQGLQRDDRQLGVVRADPVGGRLHRPQGHVDSATNSSISASRAAKAAASGVDRAREPPRA